MNNQNQDNFNNNLNSETPMSNQNITVNNNGNPNENLNTNIMNNGVTPESSAPNKKNSNKKVTIIIIICALVFWAFVIGFFFIRPVFNATKNIINASQEEKGVYENGNDDIITPEVEPDNDDIITPEVEPDDVDAQSSAPNNSNSQLSSNWQDYKFLINGKTLSLPLTYNELALASGFTIKDDYKNQNLSSNYYTTVNMYQNDKLALYTEITNNTKDTIYLVNGNITRISQTKYQVTQGANVVTFPGGLQANMPMTKEKLISILGEPDDIKNYTSDDYISDTYSFNSHEIFTTINNYKITVVNGIIDEISLDHRDY